MHRVHVLVLVLVSMIWFVGCGEPAPLESKNAKWFDRTDPENATRLENPTVKSLATLKELKLDLGGNASIRNEDLKSLKGMKNLVEIALYETAITDEGIQYLTDLPLQVLDVSQTTISDAGLVHIGKIKTLRKLELFNTKITDAGLANLAELPLFRIDLSKTAVTDAGMVEIAKIQGLERLHLADNKITDDGLATIGTIDSLRELGLYHTGKITDAGLKHLHGLKSLQALFLGVLDYTPEGLAELRKALPKTDIAGD